MKSIVLCCVLGVAGCGNDIDITPDTGSRGEPCTDVSSDPLNCGACGRTCVIPGASAGCSLGECVIASCAQGRADADGDLVNGCEAEADCSGGPLVSVHRANGDGHYYTTNLVTAQTAPFYVESQDYFRLARDPGPGLVEAYLCRKNNGRHFLSASATCEGAGPVVLSLGYWFTIEVCNTIPLFRLYRPGSPDDHFFTINAVERDRAVTDYGYVFETISGYVFPRP